MYLFLKTATNAFDGSFPSRGEGRKKGQMITVLDRDVFMLTKIQRRSTDNEPFFTTGKNMNLTRDIISIIIEIIIRPEHKAA
jgi:hypothetical protein